MFHRQQIGEALPIHVAGHIDVREHQIDLNARGDHVEGILRITGFNDGIADAPKIMCDGHAQHH